MARGRAAVTVAGGVGESPVFRNAAAEPPDLYKCHIQGVLIGDMIAAGKLTTPPVYAFTDEGIAERVAAEMERQKQHGKPSGIQFGRDPEDKKIDKFAGDLEDDHRWPAARNPQQEAIDKHTPPGFRGMMQTDIGRQHIGDQGYEIFLDKAGNRVRVGDSFLAVKSVDQYERDTRHEAAIRAELEESVNAQQFYDTIEQMYREQGASLPRNFDKDRRNEVDSGIMPDTVT